MSHHRVQGSKERSDEVNSVAADLIKASASLGGDPVRKLPRCTESKSEVIRDIIRRQYDGETSKAISFAMEKSFAYVSMLEQKHPEAFMTARAEHAGRVLAKFGVDMQIVTAMIFDAGFLAVETLKELMADPEVSAAIRQKSATSILTLINTSPQAVADKEHLADQGTVKALQAMLEEKLGDARIIDVGGDE